MPFRRWPELKNRWQTQTQKQVNKNHHQGKTRLFSKIPAVIVLSFLAIYTIHIICSLVHYTVTVFHEFIY